MWQTKLTTNAKKLKALSERIHEALDVVGEDAEWLGWHDGELRIYSADETTILEIMPYEENNDDETPTKEETGNDNATG